MNIAEWFAAGRPLTTALEGMGWDTRPVQRPPPGSHGVACYCDPAKEQTFSPAQREQWYNVCPTCRAASGTVAGLKYSESLGAFVGEGTKIPDAMMIVPTAPAPSTVSSSALAGPAPAGGPAPSFTTAKGSTMDLSTLGIIGGTAVGGPIGGVIGTGLSVLGGLGGSRCPGPYNYDQLTGQCVPKPDYWARVGGGGESPTSPGTKPTGFVGSSSPCPTGYSWDGQRCVEKGVGGAVARILPGGSTGTGMDVYGQAVVGAWGKPALVPYTGSVPMMRCPPGAVLGKDNLCYQKRSISNSNRKWPKPPAPLLTAGEMKTLRKIHSLEEKVKKAWKAAGSPGKPRPKPRKTTRRR